MNQPTPCQGLFGRIFGHRIRTVIETKETAAPNHEFRDSETEILEEATRGAFVHSIPEIVADVMSQFHPNTLTETKVVTTICTRCGQHFNHGK